MKKILLLFICLIGTLFFALPVNALEDDTISVYLFYGDGCPHCAEEKKFLSSIKDDYDDVEFIYFEVWYNNENSDFLSEVKDKLNVTRSGVPVTVIGETTFVGYSSALEGKIKRAIEFYKENEYIDAIQGIKEGTYVGIDGEEDEFSEQEEESDEDSTVDVPFFGNLNLKNVSLGTAALVLGLIDGFNPCAMWVLLFLISMLIGMKNKKRMWIIGLTFLGSSAFVYMLMMLSWLIIVVAISTSILVRNIIALIAVGGGILNFYNFFKHQDSGCSVVDEKKRKSVFERIKKFTKEKSLVLALIGTIALAFSVNII